MPTRAEISPAKLPLRDHDLFEQIAKVLKKNIKFKWRGTQEWAGLSKSDLTELTVQIAAFVGITRKQAKEITVIFGDHYKFPHNDSPPSAICQPYQRDGVYTNVVVVLNRSLEVVKEKMRQASADQETKQEHLESLGLHDPDADDEDYFCDVTAFEFVVWSIAEELIHAHIFLMAGSVRSSNAWRNRYLEMLKGKANKLNDIYDTDLDEVAANRQVLRILTYLAHEGNAKEYFRERYLESLQSRRVYMASFEKAAYTRTGYLTQKQKVNLENHSL